MEGDHGTSGAGGRGAIATRLAQAPAIIIPDARYECEDFGSPVIEREMVRPDAFLVHVGEAPEEPSFHAPSPLEAVRQSLKRGSRAQEAEVAPLQEC